MSVEALAQTAADTMCNDMAETLAVDQTSAVQLRALASEYLKIITTLESRLTTFTQWLNERSELYAFSSLVSSSHVPEDTAQRIITLTTQIKEFIRGSVPEELYDAAFNFQHKLNEILGQKVQMIFVWRDRYGHVETYEVDEKDIIKFDYNKLHQLTGRFGNISKDLRKSLTPLEKQLAQTDQIEQWIAGLQSAYNETSWRYEYGTKGLVLFKDESQNWVPFFVSAQGDINEGYAAALVSDMSNPANWGSNIEWQVATFLMEWVANVDNQSGLLRGDITVGNIEYAVKSAGASTLGLTQLKILARQIIADPNFDINKLRQVQTELEQAANVRNGTLAMLEAELSNVGQSLKDKFGGLDIAAELHQYRQAQSGAKKRRYNSRSDFS